MKHKRFRFGPGFRVAFDDRQPLKAGSLLVVERGERHEIRNTGRTRLKTVNFYYPPAYDREEEPLPAGRK